MTEIFRRRLSQRLYEGRRERYKLPVPADQAEQMLGQCYMGEMLKRGVKASVDDITRAKVAKAAKWLTGDYKTGLLLYGTVGSGKTTLALAVCELISILHHSAIVSESKGVARVTANNLVELRTACHDKERALANEQKFELFRSAPMLFIDDIGVESASIKTWGNELTPVIDLLYHRYDKQLFTIITSNLDDNGIGGFYGCRVADRFNEMFDRISYTNPSYRR